MIRLINISKSYKSAQTHVQALRKLSLTIHDNSFVAIVGESGCGKTTLLNILAGYDYQDSGLFLLDNEQVDRRKLKDLTSMVFQDFHLLPYLNVYENICLPLYVKNKPVIKEKAYETLNSLGLSNYSGFFPQQLSGGQRQRVAIARCLMMNPAVILADEPTGALDDENSRNILDILKKLQKQGLTIVMVTHDNEIARQADRIIRMENGHVVSERTMVSQKTALS